VKRPVYHRIGAACLALLLVLVEAGELFSAHPCAHHDPALYAASVSAHAGHHGEVGDPEHGGADHGGPEHGGARHGDSDEGHEAPCTCLWACVSPTPAALPEEVSITVAAAIHQAPVVLITASDLPLPRLIPFFLPFSQAPPSLG